MNDPAALLAAAVAAQTPDDIEPLIEAEWVPPASVRVRVGGMESVIEPAAVLPLLEGRAAAIRRRKEDPFRFGWEPPIWQEADWLIAELRVAFPGEPITLGVLGGNGSSKTWYAAHRMAMAIVGNDDWLIWQFSLEEKTSRETPQRYFYRYLPEELRSESGKLKKTGSTKLSYNEANGFTNNTLSLGNRSRCNFIFYNSNILALEGPRPDFAWVDEEIPRNWMETVNGRLITKAGLARAVVPLAKKALAARAAGDPEAYAKFLRPILPALLQGLQLVTFTPKSGYTPAVAKLVEKARVRQEVDAEILPIVKEGVCCGFEKVPRVQWNDAEKAAVIYFHVYDNLFGNWEGMKRLLQSKGREEKLWRAYGVACRTQSVQFPLFSREAHVRPQARLPKDGTWYHIADPCSHGRPWFMVWAKVSASGEITIAREWPQPGDWIAPNDVGDPGEWAVQSEGKKHDGDRGPAQGIWGLGFRQMAEEIERVEKELRRLECQLSGLPEEPEGRIHIIDGNRIMDGRIANQETQTHGDSKTLIQIMDDYGLHFVSAGRDSGAEQGTTTIREGVAMIVDMINYDAKQVTLEASGRYTFHGTAPRLFVTENCQNVIWCLSNWTSRDGGEGASKDPVDAVRYLVICGPIHLAEEDMQPWGGVIY